jgi:hypothetical protein
MRRYPFSELSLSTTAVWSLDLAASGALAALMVVTGLTLGRSVGLGVTCLGATSNAGSGRCGLLGLSLPLGAGLLTGAILLVLDASLFSGSSSARLAELAGAPAWVRWSLCVSAAVLEEITYRLAFMTVVVWGLTQLGVTRSRALAGGLAASALLFGLGHLRPDPVTGALTLQRALQQTGLNALAGGAMGGIYAARGLEAAIVAHLGADAVIYVIFPLLLAG